MLRSVENRVKWLLHELESFEVSAIKGKLESLSFCGSEKEKVLGCYTNDPAKDKEMIVVTDLGLHYRDGNQWDFLDYELMLEVRFPEGGKENWKSLVIKLKSGPEFVLPVKNETKSESGVMGWDVFAFRKFFIGVISGINRANVENR